MAPPLEHLKDQFGTGLITIIVVGGFFFGSPLVTSFIFSYFIGDDMYELAHFMDVDPSREIIDDILLYGIAFKPYLTVPLIIVLLFLGITIMNAISVANELITEDGHVFEGMTGGTWQESYIPYWIIGFTRFSCLFAAFTLATLSILPITSISGLVEFWLIVSVACAGVGIVAMLPFLLLNVRFAVAVFGILNGTRHVDDVMADFWRGLRKGKPDREETRSNQVDDDEVSEGTVPSLRRNVNVPAKTFGNIRHEPTSISPLSMGASAVQRVAARVDTKKLKAEAEKIRAKTDVFRAIGEFTTAEAQLEVTSRQAEGLLADQDEVAKSTQKVRELDRGRQKLEEKKLQRELEEEDHKSQLREIERNAELRAASELQGGHAPKEKSVDDRATEELVDMVMSPALVARAKLANKIRELQGDVDDASLSQEQRDLFQQMRDDLELKIKQSGLE